MTAPRNATVAVTVTDDDEDTKPAFTSEVAAQAFAPGVAIEPLTLPAASGGNGELLYALEGDLPKGLAFDADTRILSGTPETVAPAVEMTLTATDADGDQAELSFTIEIRVPLPRMSVADAASSDGAPLRFTVRLSRSAATDEAVSVRYATADGSARAGEDYEATRGVLRFARGTLEAVVEVPVLPAVHVDGERDLELRLSDARGAVLDDAVGAGSIARRSELAGAWMARFGRMAAEQTSDAIYRRLDEGSRPDGATAAGVDLGALFGPPGGVDDDWPLTHPGGAGFGRMGFDDGGFGGAGFNSGFGGGGFNSGFGGGFGGGGFNGGFNGGAGGMGFNGGFGGAGGFGGFSAGTNGGWQNTGMGVAPHSASMGGFGSPPGVGGAWHPMGGGPGMGSMGTGQTLRGLLAGSSFHYTLGATASGDQGTEGADGNGGTPSPWAFWGEAALTQFQGQAGELNLEGDVLGITAGVDRRFGERFLVGLALSHSDGDGSYGSGGGDGGVQSTLTSVAPYFRYDANDRLWLWGAAAYGQGDLSLVPDVGRVLEADLDHAMLTLGSHAVLRRGDAFELGLRADALVAHTTSEDAPGVGGESARTSRVRVLLEGSTEFEALGGQLQPKLEGGLRHDGGDAETGVGVEVGGTINWIRGGLTLTVAARRLVGHADDAFEEKGYSGSVVYEPGATHRGLRLSLSSHTGAPDSGLQALWSDQGDAAWAGRSDMAMPFGRRTEAEVGYGFGKRWVWLPYLGMDTMDEGRNLRMGLELATERFDVRIEAGRREQQALPKDDAILVEVQGEF